MALTLGCAGMSPSPQPAPTGWRVAFQSTFDRLDTAVWQASTHTFEGSASRFTPRNVAARRGRLVLTLGTDSLGDRAFTGAEIATCSSVGPLRYGRYEVRMRAARGSGVVSAFFAYRPEPWQEIDVEFLGRARDSVQVNVYNSPTGTPVEQPPFPLRASLGFDASADFHTYAYEWDPAAIRWYVDDRLIGQTTAPAQVPTRPLRIALNVWLSTTEAWAGPIDRAVLPARAEYTLDSAIGARERGSRSPCWG